MSLDPALSLQLMLGIKGGTRVSLVNAPHGFLQQLGTLPPGAEYLQSARTGLDLIVFFCQGKRELLERLPGLARSMAFTGALWVMYERLEHPPLRSDALVEDFVRFAAFEIGMMDNKRLSLVESWNGLRLVWQRRSPRPEKPSQAGEPPSC